MALPELRSGSITSVAYVPKLRASSEGDMNLRCLFFGHFWWLKEMTQDEADEYSAGEATWPPLVRVCTYCKKEEPFTGVLGDD